MRIPIGIEVINLGFLVILTNRWVFWIEYMDHGFLYPL